LQFCYNLVKRFFDDIDGDNGSAFCHKLLDECPTDAGSGTSDQSNLVIKTHVGLLCVITHFTRSEVEYAHFLNTGSEQLHIGFLLQS
jgi:hypothetical protein